jgi:hypothetical protein
MSSFGQASGPPASHQQLVQLADLLGRAGYETFREARHPFGLSQRQANGKFTRDEAAALIERLVAAEDEDHAEAPLPPDTVVAAFPDELLADELVRRGWTCEPPKGA